MIPDQLRALGVKAGGVLLVHSSFRAVRPVEGGPLGLIEALREALGPDGTLVMPSMSDDDDAPFNPATGASAPDLGIVPALFWRIDGVARSNHPFAFAAIGPHAAAITADPLPLPPHIAASRSGACTISTVRSCCSAAVTMPTPRCTSRRLSEARHIAYRGTAR